MLESFLNFPSNSAAAVAITWVLVLLLSSICCSESFRLEKNTCLTPGPHTPWYISGPYQRLIEISPNKSHFSCANQLQKGSCCWNLHPLFVLSYHAKSDSHLNSIILIHIGCNGYHYRTAQKYQHQITSHQWLPAFFWCIILGLRCYYFLGVQSA